MFAQITTFLKGHVTFMEQKAAFFERSRGDPEWQSVEISFISTIVFEIQNDFSKFDENVKLMTWSVEQCQYFLLTLYILYCLLINGFQIGEWHQCFEENICFRNETLRVGLGLPVPKSVPVFRYRGKTFFCQYQYFWIPGGGGTGTASNKSTKICFRMQH